MYSMNDKIQRRAVAYKILQKTLTRSDCMKALWILENKYADLEVIPILEYVDCIENEVLILGDNKLLISRELTKLLYGPSTDTYHR